jgi:hypothetical protein
VRIDQIAPQALKLPARERALLAATLWESIEDPNALADEMTDDESLELAMQRDAELESGAVAPLSHEDLMMRLRR